LLDFLRLVLRLVVLAAFLVSFSLTVSSASEFWLESGSLRLSATQKHNVIVSVVQVLYRPAKVYVDEIYM
jgi:hypothetical protein